VCRLAPGGWISDGRIGRERRGSGGRPAISISPSGKVIWPYAHCNTSSAPRDWTRSRGCHLRIPCRGLPPPLPTCPPTLAGAIDKPRPPPGAYPRGDRLKKPGNRSVSAPLLAGVSPRADRLRSPGPPILRRVSAGRAGPLLSRPSLTPNPLIDIILLILLLLLLLLPTRPKKPSDPWPLPQRRRPPQGGGTFFGTHTRARARAAFLYE
jgi:hypothetical protein